MEINFKQIYEGWSNHLIPPEKLKKAIINVSKERLNVCRGCEFNSINRTEFSLRPDEHCTECLCTLSAKTKCLSCHCPLGKWLAQITLEEEIKMNNNEKDSPT